MVCNHVYILKVKQNKTINIKNNFLIFEVIVIKKLLHRG